MQELLKDKKRLLNKNSSILCQKRTSVAINRRESRNNYLHGKKPWVTVQMGCWPRVQKLIKIAGSKLWDDQRFNLFGLNNSKPCCSPGFAELGHLQSCYIIPIRMQHSSSSKYDSTWTLQLLLFSSGFSDSSDLCVASKAHNSMRMCRC